MRRFARRRRRLLHVRTPVLLAGGVLRTAVVIVPPAALLLYGGQVFLRHVDTYLKGAAPLVSQEVSRSLRRDVRIGRLTPDLTLSSLLAFLRHPESFASLPITAYDISIATRETPVLDRKGRPVLDKNGTPHTFNEPALTGSRLLARAPQVTLYVSLPSLLSGNVTGAVSLIRVDSPDLWVARDRDGHLNLTQIVPPKKPQAKPSAPFRTVVELNNGRLHFSDYASSRAKLTGRPDRNALASVGGVADLSGLRDYRFDISGRAAPDSVTATRLAGPVRVWGSWGRAEVGSRPDAPSATSARYLLQARAQGADVPYWYYYFTTGGLATPGSKGTDAFRILAGRADADLSLAGPRPDRVGGPIPNMAVSMGGRFTGAAIQSGYAPLSVRSGSGNLSYNDGNVTLDVRGTLHDARGRSLGAPVSASGVLWDLTARTPLPGTAAQPGATPPPAAKPSLAITIDAPRVPTAAVVGALATDRGYRLPTGLRVGGDAGVNVLLSGTVPDLTATGTVRNVSASYPGYPAVRSASAGFTYAGGLVRVTDARAAFSGGGTAEGRATIRLTGTPAERGAVQFSARGRGIDLASLGALRSLGGGNPRFRLTGTGDVEAVGSGRPDNLSVAANVSARGLALGRLAFPVARARVLVSRNAGGLAFSVPAARIESPAGALAVGGDLGAGGALNVRWSATALDLASLGSALGMNGLSGLVTASGTLGGTARAPRATVADLVGLNLRVAVPNAAKTSAGAPSFRRFAADVVRARDVAVTARGIALNRPVVVRRFPAAAYVIGTVTNLLPRTTPGGSGKATFNPRLALTAKVENLEFSEIERQLREEVSRAALRAVVRPTVANAAPDPPPVSGEVTSATFSVRGPLSALHVAGTANVGRLLVRAGQDSATGKPIEYPLDSGSFDFSYNRQRTRVTDVVLQASVGTVTGSFTLLPSGAISGALRAPSLDTERLAFLTKRYFSLGGKLAASAVVGGTLRRPTVTTQVGPSDLTIAGLPLSALQLRNLTYSTDLDAKTSRVDLAALTFRQGSSEVTVNGTYLELPTYRFATDVRVSSGNLGQLVDALRNSGLRDTEAGRSFVKSLDSLPSPISGQVAVDRFQVSGRLAPEQDEQGRTVRRLTDATGEAHLTATDLRIGTFTAPSMEARATLAGDVIRLDRFTADIPGAQILARGDYHTSGRLNLSLDSNGAQLEALRTLPPLANLPLAGAVDLSVQVTGALSAPTITASVSGSDIDVVRFVADKPRPVPVFRLDQLTFTGDYVEGENGLGRVTLREGSRVRAGAAEVNVAGTVPISRRPNDPRLASQPISLFATTNRIDLGQFANLFARPEKDRRGREGSPAELSGFVTARVGIGGPDGGAIPLGDARLAGLVTVEDGRFRLARPAGEARDRINPIRDLDARLTLAGDRINVDQFTLGLGGPGDPGADYGSLTITGGVTLSALNALERLLTPARKDATTAEGEAAPPDTSENIGTLGLRANFNGLRIAEENLFNYGEAVTGRIDGALGIDGPLATPKIAAVEGPIHLRDPRLTLASRQPATSGKSGALPVIPTFGADSTHPIPIVIDGKASLLSPGTFRFDATGVGEIGGSLQTIATANGSAFALDASATLDVVGGFFQLPTARFRVQKDGRIALGYQNGNLSVVADNVIATTRVYSGANIANYASGRERGPVGTFAVAPVAQQTQAYDITATLKGPLLLAADASLAAGGRDAETNRPQTLDLSGVNRQTGQTLSKGEIIALLGSQEQIDLLRQNRVNEAVQGFTQQVLYSAYVPQYLAPLTESLQNSLGLTNLAVDYNPAGFTSIFAQARLPVPFDRFIAEYQQRLYTRGSQPGQLQPYSFSFGYELFKLRPVTSRIQPRMQLGFSTNEQRVLTYFLRGTVAY
jgi:hypothetical protein